MNDLLFSFYLKLPNEHYPLSYQSEAFKNTFLELQKLIDVNPELSLENIRVWALYLQKINLAQFSQAELLAVMAIDIAKTFNYETEEQTYFIPASSNILYSQGLLVNQELDHTEIERLYKSQIKLNFYYSKTFLQELFITYS